MLGCLMPAAIQGLADRLVELFAVVLDQRLEEAHAEHLAFALVDAGGEVLVHVVAEHVTVQERAAAMRLHEELDHGLFLRFAAEDLGDRAFHLAAVAFIQEPRAPVDECVAADDEARQTADAAADQFTLGDEFAVRSCGSGPKAGCWPSSAASKRQPSRRQPRDRDSGRDRPQSGRRRPSPRADSAWAL